MPPFRARSIAASALFAVVFFLASADKFFAIRTSGVNVRFASFALFAGLVLWVATRASKSRDDIRWLAIAWMPFVALYGVAAALSEVSGPAILKIGWFVFSFSVAYTATALFDARDLVRGYFVSFVAISTIIVVDFVTGFTRGSDYMIGYGQRNEMVGGMPLFRPHAFYYEPSFAASGLALAWALALTRMRDAAPHVATALVVIGGIALVVLTSRTGWLYATVAAVGVLGFRLRAHRLQPRASLAHVVVPAVLGIALLAVLFAPSDRRDAVSGLLARLGFAQAFERVCPRLAEELPIDLRCIPAEARRQFLGELPDSPDETPEGKRLMDMRAALANIAQHPWFGVGVARGPDRFIAAPVAPNMWLELAAEGGFMVLLAFLFGIGYTLWHSHAFNPRHRDIMIVLALWFLIAWQFIATFARLDLWIAFCVVLVWTRRHSDAKVQARIRHAGGAGSVKGFTPLGIATQ